MELLWADLLNSDWHDHRGSGAREDRLGNDAWRASFLARAGWGEAGRLGARELGRLRELRALLRRLVDTTIQGRSPRSADLAALDAVLGRAPHHLRVLHGRKGWSVERVSVARGLDALLGRVAAGFAEMLARGEPGRLKICANPDCLWVMWDESRNGSRRWCSAAECGNLERVRRFRRRRSRGGRLRNADRNPGR